MRYERVKVTRDTNTVHSREVPPWEIPILEYLFGDDGNVVRTGDFVEVTPGTLINREYPTGRKELSRLTQAYGTDPKSGIPYAISVYGNGSMGERALQKLIDEAKVEDNASTAVKTPIPASTRKRGRPAAVDSLLS